MLKKLCVIIFVFSLLSFYSCETINQNAKNNLDWDGVYTGIMPGANSAISVEIILKRDGTYNISYQYIDKSNEVFRHTGTFKWKNNNTVELDNNEIPSYYLVGKNTLTQLNMAGKKITGEHADMYVLKKQ